MEGGGVSVGVEKKLDLVQQVALILKSHLPPFECLKDFSSQSDPLLVTKAGSDLLLLLRKMHRSRRERRGSER